MVLRNFWVSAVCSSLTGVMLEPYLEIKIVMIAGMVVYIHCWNGCKDVVLENKVNTKKTFY